MSGATFKTMSAHKSWEWPTPKTFYDLLDAEFHFDFDPCPVGGGRGRKSTTTKSMDWKARFLQPPVWARDSKVLSLLEGC